MIAERDRLHEGFASFVAAAGELERSYKALAARAAAVDVELRATNRQLEQALGERDAVFGALPTGLVVLRSDGSVARANAEAERLIEAARQAGIQLVRSAPGEIAFVGHTVSVRRVPLPSGEVVLLEDRSRMLELEREVHRLDRLAGLSELALGVAHEIKNPLNGVQGFAALLARSDDPQRMRMFAGKVVEGVRQVDEIVKSLLAFARPRRQRGRTEALSEIVAGAAQAAGLPSSRLQLGGALTARVDAEVLTRVLTNLFRNALEAAPEASITLRGSVQGTTLELRVRDDGPGIPVQVGRRIFEPFVSTKERGTGLGLALCVRVLAFLGGNLELTNPGEPGAEFLVRLPLVDEAGPSAEREGTA